VSDDRKKAERRVGLARLWARAKQIVTTDPSGSDEDDHVVDEEAARVLAANAGRLKGGLAKVAQLAAYDPGATLGGRTGATQAARQVLGGLWDRAPAVSVSAISRVIEDDLGKSPQSLFASWDASPLASASLGQVHAATLADGTEVAVKVQYPGVAEALRTDLDDDAFLRKLAGAEIGRSLPDDSLVALREAVRGELDYRAEAAAQEAMRAAWADHKAIRIPRVIPELSSERVLTMTRARGKTILETAASGSPELRRAASLAIYDVAWGSPIQHRLLNADPNPGNFLVEEQRDGSALVWCLDFGCSLELPERVRDTDRELWWALLDDDVIKGAERFRMGLAASGLLARTDRLATVVHREWEQALAAPLSTHGDFHWSPAYASQLAETTGRVLAAGGMHLPARLLLLWRQRLGVSAVLGMLDAKAPFRRVLLDRIGNGKKALR
jgi:predicted unusual protein kinase regulating ubiquinone biosynthesis (AarF/ABC1/UbiB family)